MEKKKASSSIAINIRKIVGGTDSSKHSSSSSSLGTNEARRKTLAMSVLCCLQRLVDDSASLEFLCSLSCLDCSRPVPRVVVRILLDSIIVTVVVGTLPR